eukprot:TRINITY_DN8113_c0_g1_i1.p1 TRINITY_DN8113_c0_g1~~TRINITY_DN8113_c0_g1_i1.p1  ORF type:complete len:496 (+),score=123.25 TRINITY_DN8113_c0_g1_i1:69-1556(+)
MAPPPHLDTRRSDWRQRLSAAAAAANGQKRSGAAGGRSTSRPVPPGSWGWVDGRPSSGSTIPKLWPSTGPQSDLVFCCRHAEKKAAIQRRQSELPEAGELWRILQSESRSDGDDGELVLPNYSVYRQLALSLLASGNRSHYYSSPLLTPSLYFLGRCPKGAPALPLFTHSMRKLLLYQMRLQLEECDSSGDGHLSEDDLDEFIDRLIPNLRTIRNISRMKALPAEYHVFYRCHAVRKFFFFLDPKRRGRVSIDAVMGSSELMELLKLYQINAQNEDEIIENPEAAAQADMEGGDDIGENWFAFHIMSRVYQHYVELDADWNGMLSATEMRAYNDSSFSPLFVDRVFEAFPTYGYSGEIDFKRYLDFVLATEHAQTPQAVSYFFRALDIGGCGFMAPAHVALFAKELSAKLEQSNLMNIEVADIVREIFDMVNPKDPERITQSDLIRAAQFTVAPHSVLVDHRAFYNYDQRENMLQQAARKEDAPPPPPECVADGP